MITPLGVFSWWLWWTSAPWVQAIEQHLYAAIYSLIPLAWVTGDVGFSLLWYCLTVLTFVVMVLQLIVPDQASLSDPTIAAVGRRLDLWGSPYTAPSYVVTLLAAILTYAAHYFYTVPTARVTPIVLMYFGVMVVALMYLIISVAVGCLTDWLVSVTVGTSYAALTSYWMHYVFPAWWRYHLQPVMSQWPWSLLLGDRSSVFPPDDSEDDESRTVSLKRD